MEYLVIAAFIGVIACFVFRKKKHGTGGGSYKDRGRTRER